MRGPPPPEPPERPEPPLFGTYTGCGQIPAPPASPWAMRGAEVYGVVMWSGPQVRSAIALATAAVAAAVPTAIGNRQRPSGIDGSREPEPSDARRAGGRLGGRPSTDAAIAARTRARWRGRPSRPSSWGLPAAACSAAMSSIIRSPL